MRKKGQTVGIAIIGAGNVGGLHAAAIAALPEARLVVACDQAAKRAQHLAGKYNVDWCTDYSEAVSRTDVDLVNVCTPSGAHAEVAVAAAQAGKHVMVEKPIEITLERIDQIIHACRTNGVKLAGIFPSRFTEGVQRTKKALENGRIGRLTLADAYIKWYRTQEYYDTDWRGTWELDGGGALMNQSIHTIDLLQWLAGPVEAIYGHTATLAHQMETEDTAAAVLTFKNGAMGVIEGATSIFPGQPASLELRGDRGTIILEDGRITTWKLADASPEEEKTMLSLEKSDGTGASDPMGISFEKHRRQIADMLTAIREDRSPLVDGTEGRKAVEIILAIYHSAKSGKVVKLPLRSGK